MIRANRHSGLVLVFVLVLASGCSKALPKDSRTAVDLKDIHEIYGHYIKSQEKAPSKLDDLTDPRYEGIYPATVRSLKTGKYVVNFGVKDKDSGTILAYEATTPTSGGAVLMADGTIKAISADQFPSKQ